MTEFEPVPGVLFDATYRLMLQPLERERFLRPLKAGPGVKWGGQQTFIHGLQHRLRLNGELPVNDQELNQAYRYAYKYRQGGWQGYSTVLLAAAQRVGWLVSPVVAEEVRRHLAQRQSDAKPA